MKFVHYKVYTQTAFHYTV